MICLNKKIQFISLLSQSSITIVIKTINAVDAQVNVPVIIIKIEKIGINQIKIWISIILNIKA